MRTYLPHEHCQCIYVSGFGRMSNFHAKHFRMQNLRSHVLYGSLVILRSRRIDGMNSMHEGGHAKVTEARMSLAVNQYVGLYKVIVVSNHIHYPISE